MSQSKPARDASERSTTVPGSVGLTTGHPPAIDAEKHIPLQRDQRQAIAELIERLAANG